MEDNSATNDRLIWIEHAGKRILFADYKGLEEDSLLRQIENNQAYIIDQGKLLGEKRLLVLSDVRDIMFTEKVMWAYRELGHNAEPYLFASAIVGITGLLRPVFDMYNKLMSLKRRAFSDPEKAKDWLASQ